MDRSPPPPPPPSPASPASAEEMRADRGRPRSRSTPLPAMHRRPPLQQRPEVTRVPTGRLELPPQFQSVLRDGVQPGSQLPNAMHSADVDPRPQVSVQRVPAQPSPAHLQDAMTNPARGIIPVTAERQGQPLQTEMREHPLLPVSYSALTDAAQQEAQQRVQVSMLVSSRPPADGEPSPAVTEQFVPSLPPERMTGVAVSQPLQAQLQPHVPGPAGPAVGVGNANFPAVRLGGAQATTSVDAPDYRPFIRAQTADSPRDFHVVRADAVRETRPRSRTI